jgi:hypothetical protein
MRVFLRLCRITQFQEHHPGQQGQAVDIAVQALVLAQDVAGGLDERGKLLCGSLWEFGFAGSGHAVVVSGGGLA